MKLFKITKADEMELEIVNKSNRIGHLFITIALCIIMLIRVFKGEDWYLPLYLICGQNIIIYLAKQFYRKQLGDDGWKKDLFQFLIIAVMLILAVLIIPLFMIRQ